MMQTENVPCPCDSKLAYGQCCGLLHEGKKAETAEQLMRSRYSAFVMQNTDYLLRTWHESTRPSHDDLAADPKTKWLGLDVRHHRAIDDKEAEVEFVARYKVNGRAHRLHETSQFVKEQDQWFYLQGQIHD